VWHICRSQKNDESRDVPLGSTAVAALERYGIKKKGKVFCYTQDGFRSSWSDLKDKVGLHNFHFHDLRHEAVSRLLEQDLGVMDVASISGQSSFAMLKRYTHQHATGLAKK
jgi:integrase